MEGKRGTTGPFDSVERSWYTIYDRVEVAIKTKKSNGNSKFRIS